MDVKTYLQALSAIYANMNQTLELDRGLSNSVLDEAEKQLGFKLVSPLRELWGYANGGNEWSTVFARKDYFCRYDFLSLASSLTYRDRMKKRAQHYVDYQHSAGAATLSNESIGKSRGGNSIKIHLAVDSGGLPIYFELSRRPETRYHAYSQPN